MQGYVFATHKKLKLGPGQYDPTYDQVKQRSLTTTLVVEAATLNPTE